MFPSRSLPELIEEQSVSEREREREEKKVIEGEREETKSYSLSLVFGIISSFVLYRLLSSSSS